MTGPERRQVCLLVLGQCPCHLPADCALPCSQLYLLPPAGQHLVGADRVTFCSVLFSASILGDTVLFAMDLRVLCVTQALSCCR